MDKTIAQIEARLGTLNQLGLKQALKQVDLVCQIPSMRNDADDSSRDLNTPFSLQIKAGRKKRGWTQSQLAEMTGLSLMTIRRYEKYGREPRFREAKRILDIIYGGDEDD